jgi:hypothetical protein
VGIVRHSGVHHADCVDRLCVEVAHSPVLASEAAGFNRNGLSYRSRTASLWRSCLVQRGGIGQDALGFYGDRFLVSLAGVLSGVAVAVALRRWFSLAALAVSTWMLLLFGLMGSVAD